MAQRRQTMLMLHSNVRCMFDVLASASPVKLSDSLPLSDAIDALGDQSSLLPHILRLCALLRLDAFKFLHTRAAAERLKAEQARSAEIRRMRAASASSLESHFSAQQSSANDQDTWNMIAAPIPPEPSAPDAEVSLYEAYVLNTAAGAAQGSSIAASKRPVARFIMQMPPAVSSPPHGMASRESPHSESSTAAVASLAAPEFKPATFVAPAKSSTRSVSAAVTSTVTAVSSVLSGLVHWPVLSPTFLSAVRASPEPSSAVHASADAEVDDNSHIFNTHALSADFHVVEDHFGIGVGGVDSAAQLTASQFYTLNLPPAGGRTAGSGVSENHSSARPSPPRPSATYRPFGVLQHPIGAAGNPASVTDRAQTTLPAFPASPPSPSGSTSAEAAFRW